MKLVKKVQSTETDNSLEVLPPRDCALKLQRSFFQKFHTIKSAILSNMDAIRISSAFHMN